MVAVLNMISKVNTKLTKVLLTAQLCTLPSSLFTVTRDNRDYHTLTHNVIQKGVLAAEGQYVNVPNTHIGYSKSSLI